MDTYIAATAERSADQDDFAHPGARARHRARALLPGEETGADWPGVPDGWGRLPQPPQPRPPDLAERVRHWREAVCERLPVWVRLRCGLELRTIVAITGVLVAAAGLAVHHFLAGRPRTITAPPSRSTAMAPAAHALEPMPGPPPRDAGPPASAPAATGVVVVDVSGKVRDPGVRRLAAGSRVTDALKAAGGALPGADTSSLNLARPLVDGEQLLVGRPPGVPAPGAAPPPGAPASPPQPVSLSTATAEQLDALPGVGPVLARRIIEYRAQHGAFTSVSQLRQVSGVGDRRFQDLRTLVVP